MATITVTENPRRRKRRRYTAKQRAAGFGGRRTARRRGRRRPRRRNPMLASLGNPRRRPRNSPRRRPRYTVTGISRRRRNPKLGPFNIDLRTAAWVGAGVLSVEILPRIGKRFWAGMPTVGLTGSLVKVAAAVLAGMLVGKVSNRNNGYLVTAGGLAMVLVDLFRQYAAPHLPFLSGVGNDESYLMRGELEDLYGGVGAYVDTDQMGAFVDSPEGAF